MSFAVTRTRLRSGSRVQAAQGSTPLPLEKGVLVRSRALACGRVLDFEKLRVHPYSPPFLGRASMPFGFVLGFASFVSPL